MEIYSPAPQPEDHNRDLDPGFKEDPDISVELKEGFLYQASYDGTKVAIIDNYPSFLPSSHVSILKVSPQKDFSYCTLPTAMSCVLKGVALVSPRRIGIVP